MRGLMVVATPPVGKSNTAEDFNASPHLGIAVVYGSLWERHCHRLAGLGHAPFWEAPGDFDPLFERFLGDVESGHARRPT
jgi:hypothetical protein